MPVGGASLRVVIICLVPVDYSTCRRIPSSSRDLTRETQRCTYLHAVTNKQVTANRYNIRTRGGFTCYRGNG